MQVKVEYFEESNYWKTLNIFTALRYISWNGCHMFVLCVFTDTILFYINYLSIPTLYLFNLFQNRGLLAVNQIYKTRMHPRILFFGFVRVLIFGNMSRFLSSLLNYISLLLSTLHWRLSTKFCLALYNYLPLLLNSPTLPGVIS